MRRWAVGMSWSLLLVIIANPCAAQVGESPDAKGLIDKLRQQQDRIKFVQSGFELRNEAIGLSIRGTWCFSADGRQACQTHRSSMDEKTNKVYKYDHDVTFDGKKQRIMIKGEGDPFATGRVDGLEPESFACNGTPYDMLGYGFDLKLGKSLADTLRDAQEVNVRPKTEMIDGHACYVVEAVHTAVDKESREAYDMRVWLDAERDLRPLRIEKYFGLAGANRWKALLYRMDITKLIQADGIWFPVQATRNWYNIDWTIPPGVTTQEAVALHEKDLDQWQSRLIVKNPWLAKEELTTDPASVVLNKPIPPERFTIEFPLGTRLWDGFLKKGYYVGGRTVPHPGQPEMDKISTDPYVPDGSTSAPSTAPTYRPATRPSIASQANATDAGEPPRRGVWILAVLGGMALGVIVVAFLIRRRNSKPGGSA